MKRILYLLPVLFLLLSACKKEQNNAEIVICVWPGTWKGPWELNAYWNSPGAGQVSWSPATEKVTINFGADITFSSTKGDQDHYIISTNTKETILKLYKQGNTDTSSFILKLEMDTLYLYNQACIEGCAEKYVRPTNAIQQ